jgi:hypothetical protein
MAPKWDQCYRYEAKAEAFMSCGITLERDAKPVAV